MSEIPPPPAPPRTPGGSFTPPPPSGGTGGTGSDRTIMVILAYLWILALIPLLMKKEDREVQWHAKNGLVILGAEIVIWIVFLVLGFAMPDIAGCGVATIQCVVWLAFLVVRIIAIVKAVNGQRFKVPVISDFADKF